MSYIGIGIIIFVVLFVLGNILAMRPNAQEKALGQLREAARLQGLNPKYMALPAWAQTNESIASGGHAGMAGFYSLIYPDATFPLVQAKVLDSKVFTVNGDRVLQDAPFTYAGAKALVIQSNHIGVYWDELADLNPNHLPGLEADMRDLVSLLISKTPQIQVVDSELD